MSKRPRCGENMESADSSNAAVQAKQERAKRNPKQPVCLEEEIQAITIDWTEPAHVESDVYKEPSIQELLNYLLEDDKNTLVPTYNPTEGFVYEKLKQILKGNPTPQTSLEFLNRLAKLDILHKSFFDSADTCPDCQSTMITIHKRCPKCKSHQVSKTSLIEHVSCGYIAEREQYIQGRCPKCGNPPNQSDFKNVGRWYICKDCQEEFEKPEVEYICRKCGNTFNTENAKTVSVSKYQLNPQRKREIRQNVASIEGIIQVIKELGFSIKKPGVIVGKESGTKHQFSVIAKGKYGKKEVIIAIDEAVAGLEVQASALIVYKYKISEVQIDLPIFIAIPKLSEEAKKIIQGHNILVIEGIPTSKADLLELGKKIEKRIQLSGNLGSGSEEGDGKRAILSRLMFKREELKPSLIDVISSIHPTQQWEESKNASVSAPKKNLVYDKNNRDIEDYTT